MSDIRVITLECLLGRLEHVLGQNSLLYHRFVQGLRHEDENCLTDAMVSLRLYPDEIRRMVEDTVMSWLFGARGDAIAGPLESSPQGSACDRSPHLLAGGPAGPPAVVCERRFKVMALGCGG
jgi:hypothetical protein